MKLSQRNLLVLVFLCEILPYLIKHSYVENELSLQEMGDENEFAPNKFFCSFVVLSCFGKLQYSMKNAQHKVPPKIPSPPS